MFNFAAVNKMLTTDIYIKPSSEPKIGTKKKKGKKKHKMNRFGRIIFFF